MTVDLHYDEQKSAASPAVSSSSSARKSQQAVHSSHSRSTVTNSHTGNVVSNPGPHGTSKVSAENVHHVHVQEHQTEKFFRKGVPQEEVAIDPKRRHSPAH
eukprot:gene2011-2194_t